MSTPPHDPWFFLAKPHRRRASRAAVPARRCRRARCWPSTSRMPWRAMPCMPASIARSLRSALGRLSLTTLEIDSEAVERRPICGGRMPAAG